MTYGPKLSIFTHLSKPEILSYQKIILNNYPWDLHGWDNQLTGTGKKKKRELNTNKVTRQGGTPVQYTRGCGS